MKRLFFSLLMVMMAGIALAQYIVPDTALTSKDAIYHRLGVSYASINFNDDDHPQVQPLCDVGTVPGISLAYTMGMPMFRNRPLFFETGLEGSFFFASKEKRGIDLGYKWVNFSMPLNLKYYMRVLRTGWHISPFVGLDLNFNAYGRLKHGEMNDGKEINVISKSNRSIRYFERFTYGVHVGVGIDYDRYHFRFMYGYCELYNSYVFSDSFQFGFFYDI